MTLSRRDLLRGTLAGAAAFLLPAPLRACAEAPESGEAGAAPAPPETPAAAEPADAARLREWVAALRGEGFGGADRPLGAAAARVGELAIGTPYVPGTLEEYLKVEGAPPRSEPLTLHLDRFDCVTLVESCLAIARVARMDGEPTWERFAAEVERVRYRDGRRDGYASRLHYFSEWLADNERRGLVRRLGEELGATADTRPLRFMSTHAESYPAMADAGVRREIAAMERRLDASPRGVVPTARIPEVSERIETGDVLAFATSIEGLDVTHSAFAYRDDAGVLRVLHAPLSGGSVEITRSTLPEYVAAIRRATGILVARPLAG